MLVSSVCFWIVCLALRPVDLFLSVEPYDKLSAVLEPHEMGALGRANEKFDAPSDSRARLLTLSIQQDVHLSLSLFFLRF